MPVVFLNIYSWINIISINNDNNINIDNDDDDDDDDKHQKCSNSDRWSVLK